MVRFVNAPEAVSVRQVRAYRLSNSLAFDENQIYCPWAVIQLYNSNMAAKVGTISLIPILAARAGRVRRSAGHFALGVLYMDQDEVCRQNVLKGP
jgi:hypothetical protein